VNQRFSLIDSILFVFDSELNKKAELTKGFILRQLGHLGILRSAAFRPPLAKGLALS
jgi:hypothetical protein